MSGFILRSRSNDHSLTAFILASLRDFSQKCPPSTPALPTLKFHHLMTIFKNVPLSEKIPSGQDSPFIYPDPHRSPYERFFPPYQPGPSRSPATKPSPLGDGVPVQDSPFIYPDPHRSPYERFFPPYQPGPSSLLFVKSSPFRDSVPGQDSPFDGA